MWPLEWALIEFNLCPYKKRKFGHMRRNTRDLCTQEFEEAAKGDHLQAKKRGLKGNQSGWHFDFRLPAPRAVRKLISIVAEIQCVIFCHGSPSTVIYHCSPKPQGLPMTASSQPPLSSHLLKGLISAGYKELSH